MNMTPVMAQAPFGNGDTKCPGGYVPPTNVDGDKLAGAIRSNSDDDAQVRSVPGENVLHITDGRTGLNYDIPITNNYVRALDFLEIKVPIQDKGTLQSVDTKEGLRLLDPGFQNTAVKKSKITFVGALTYHRDGSKGDIQYRGHPIETLVGQKQFEDIMYLLIWGHLPSEVERINFGLSLATFPLPPQMVFDTIKAFPTDSPPIPIIIAAFSSLAASQPDMIPALRAKNLYMGEAVAVQHQMIRTLANVAYITAAVYCHQNGREIAKPDPYLSYVENILRMMGHVDKETGRPNPIHVDMIQRLWTLTADHEMTNSTAAFLHTASTLSDPIMSLISGLASSWGILHGGAIEVAYRELERLGDVSAVHEKIEAAKSGKERLFGYGHRIYKVTDPRYIFIRKMLDDLVTEDTEDKILKVAMELDKAASSDEYFTSRKLKANADFFSSFVYKAL
ncbi:MAG: hypothetical protein Q9201_007656 [Fulgogasparrea decipioides]